MGGFFISAKRVAAVIIGIVFLLAGLFKLLDPAGSALVVKDYLSFMHLSFLEPLAKALAVALALLEALAGAALISGVWRKAVAVLVLVLLHSFTLLTLTLAIFNPIMDCGCFGEVLHLSNLQTFLKNLALLALAFFAFIPLGALGKPKRRKYLAFGLVGLSIVAFAVYSLLRLPLVDYTSFAPGNYLMAAGGGEESPQKLELKYIYEKNGQRGIFPLDRLPDSTWTFVGPEELPEKVLSAGESQPILSFRDSAGVYMDNYAAEGNVLVFSVYEPERLGGEDWTELSQAVLGAKEADMRPLLLVAGTYAAYDSLETIVPQVRELLQDYVYVSDYKTLITLNRSNGGACWLSGGQIVRKFSHSGLPTPEEVLELTGLDPTEEMLSRSSAGRARFHGFLLYALLLLII